MQEARDRSLRVDEIKKAHQFGGLYLCDSAGIIEISPNFFEMRHFELKPMFSKKSMAQLKAWKSTEKKQLFYPMFTLFWQLVKKHWS